MLNEQNLRDRIGFWKYDFLTTEVEMHSSRMLLVKSSMERGNQESGKKKKKKRARLSFQAELLLYAYAIEAKRSACVENKDVNEM